jgi:electron transfer flavoprotein alpha subunit
MAEIFIVVEHRDGRIREITYGMLHKAGVICSEFSHTLTAIVLTNKETDFIDDLAKRSDRVMIFEDERFRIFDGTLYKEVLSRLIKEYRPFLTLIGHTSWGVDLAPALSVKIGCPLATDCVDILMEDNGLKAVRQIYGGKAFSRVAFKDSDSYLLTVRAAAFPPEPDDVRRGEVMKMEIPSDLPEPGKQFLEFVDTGVGEVDISQAELLLSVGRGIGEEENIDLIKDLADAMGGTVSCSRPVVDKGWLPKYHQVGTSGKSVKPKVYLAFGISGAFQHVAGISGAGTVIAINKDKKAPILRVADYGVIDDLLSVVGALKEEMKD